MIEPMKKVTIVAAARTEAETMASLRSLAVLHLKLDQPLDHQEYERLRADEQAIHEARQIVRGSRREEAQSPNTPATPIAGLELAHRLVELKSQSDQLAEKLAALRLEKAQLNLLGLSDPKEMEQLSEAGISAHLRRIPRDEWKRISPQPLLHPLAETDGSILAVDFSNRPSIELPGTQVALPRRSVDEIETVIAEAEHEQYRIEAEIIQLSCSADLLISARGQCRDAMALVQAHRALASEEPVISVTGYCPVNRIGMLRDSAEQRGWALVVTEPGEDEMVPTLLRHDRLSRIFQPIMSALGLAPGYREFHTHAIFLVFFTVFFAMIIGDAGYGALMLGVTFGISRLCPRVPRHPLALSYLLGSATILWGGLTGAWFGVEQLRHTAPLSWFVLPALDTWVQTSQANVMRLCLAIGALHLILARAWAAVRKGGSERVTEVGWIFIVGGTCLAAFKLLLDAGQWFAPMVSLAVGTILLILFSEQKNDQPFLMGFAWGIIKLPLNLLSFVSSFSDAVSYVRLFAVGLATLEMASAFNQLAADIGWDSFAAAIGASLVVILGHTANLLLAAMGVLVHGIRLNLLEFSRHLGMAWTGIPYEPFRPLDKET